MDQGRRTLHGFGTGLDGLYLIAIILFEYLDFVLAYATTVDIILGWQIMLYAMLFAVQFDSKILLKM